MNAELLEIQPPELNFIFEVKKQCSCSIRLVSKSSNHVAFKIKTTSPKKYCVRPNIGVIKPNSSCDFTVTMQAQKVAPPDMVCKDKFLVQSTVVPAGTTDEDITSSMFSKDDGRYIEENKMRVILISPPNSPVLSPINGTLKPMPCYEPSTMKDQVAENVESKMEVDEMVKPAKDVDYKILQDMREPERDVEYKTLKGVGEPGKDAEFSTMKDVEEPKKGAEDKIIKGVEEPGKDAEYKVTKDVREPERDVEYKTTKDVGEPENDVECKTMKDVIDPRTDMEYKTTTNVEEPSKDVEYVIVKDLGESVDDVKCKTTKDVEELAKDVECKTMKEVEVLKLIKDIETMKLKLNELGSKLTEAESSISKLTEERIRAARERENLQQELALLRSKKGGRKVQGFPFLFVCMVALISVMLGYLVRG